MKTLNLAVVTLALASSSLSAQDFKSHLKGTELTFEVSGTASSGEYAPLWLMSNRYGLGSVRPYSNYERARVERDIHLDADLNWRLGYGLDLALTFGHERRGIVQQAYVEGAWKKLRLTLGAKQQPMEAQNAELSSGALSLGINGRPIPQVRLDIDQFSFPGTKGWWKWKLYASYGWMTDGRWQQKWAEPNTRYARHVLYHEKALYWDFGRADIFPLTFGIGLRMATTFGGTSYNVVTNRSEGTVYKHNSGLKGYWQALTAQGSDTTDGTDPNVAGNHLGSWLLQLRYHGQSWKAKAYFERFFEDHSMLTVQYGIRDMLVGGEVSVPSNPFVSTAVLEYLTTTNQSGAVFHDPTKTLPDQIAGRDNYYNHLNYAGWQNYGLTLGNPLMTSPLYNDAFGVGHQLYFMNNRVKAWHVGLSGDPSSEWHWRLLVSFTRNWGSYDVPLSDVLRQNSALAEVTYRPDFAPGWGAKVGLALDRGKLLGNSFGGQLTISKQLTLVK